MTVDACEYGFYNVSSAYSLAKSGESATSNSLAEYPVFLAI